MNVKEIDKKRITQFVLHRHYAHRMPQNIQASFGLFDDGLMVGCVCYSIPASYTLCQGVCGYAHRKKVLELSRLVIETKRKNAASMLVGRSLAQLPKPRIVVSYADPNEGHVGYVYQATNWIYTGRGNPEPWWRHPDTGEVISKTRRHIDRKAKAIGLEWTDLIKDPKQGKHRYVYFVGDRKNQLRNALRYSVEPFPKGSTHRFEFDDLDDFTLKTD